MYLLENPVLQRELLVNLRMHRAFVLLFVYVALLGVVVYAAWPAQQRLDLAGSPEEAKRLVNMFFLGQYILMSLMAPSFAAGAITGEKERKTYEMLLASPLGPRAIVVGKLLASLCHLAVLVFASLPIVMLCLPLGGVSLWEVVATYLAMGASVVTFGMISLAASSYFSRTVASLVVSYLLILPLALVGVLFYMLFEDVAAFRLVVLAGVFPGGCAVVCGVLLVVTSARLLHPPDVGSGGKEVVDLEEEQREAVGMIIRSRQFPDRLFAPPKRTELMADSTNPVYDKEMRSELFGHGSLMLRLVIQLSMFPALPLMAVFLYIWPAGAPWYTSYVLLFNMLVGPVFSAGSVTNERERGTMELLLTTTVSPWQILSGKLYSSLRISCVLTSFLVWPLLLAWLLPPWTYYDDTLTMIAYVAIIAVTSLTTTMLALFCSVIFRKTTVSMISAYLVVILLFALPVAAKQFAELFLAGPSASTVTLLYDEPDGRISQTARFRLSGPAGSCEISVERNERLEAVAKRINTQTPATGVMARLEDGRQLALYGVGTSAVPVTISVQSGSFNARPPTIRLIRRLVFTSPFAAAFSLPLTLGQPKGERAKQSTWWAPTTAAFLLFYLLVDVFLAWAMLRLFRVRWRVVR